MLLKFTTKNIEFYAKTRESETSKIIIKNLPIKSKINTWGDEIYFDTRLKTVKLEEDSKDVFELGEIAYWVDGAAIAIGFGRTPASKGNEIRLVSKCNYWADAVNPSDLLKFKQSSDNDLITVDIK